jgi:hypothetical protein
MTMEKFNVDLSCDVMSILERYLAIITGEWNSRGQCCRLIPSRVVIANSINFTNGGHDRIPVGSHIIVSNQHWSS